MSNNQWITDRLPTIVDADYQNEVWITDDLEWVVRHHYTMVAEGTPWMPIYRPEPYVKPKRVRVVQEQRYDDDGFDYAVTFGIGTVARHIPTREAAERIAAIYEEVMP